MRIGSFTVFVLGILACTQVAFAQLVLVSRVEGSDLEGRLEGLVGGKVLKVRTESGSQEIPLKEVISVEFPGMALAPASGGVRLDLVSGDVLFGALDEGNFDEFSVGTLAGGSVKLLLDHLSLLTYSDNSSPETRLPDRASESEQDELFIQAKEKLDRLPGELLRIGRASVVFNSAAGKERAFSFLQDKVVAVRVAPGEPYREPDEFLCVARFRDGSRLTGVLFGQEGGAWQLKLTVGPTITLDAGALASLSFRNATFRFLSDLEPKDLEEVPFLEGGPKYGLSRDRGLGKDVPLRIGSRTFRKGIVLHARTKVTYDLGGRYSGFSAFVGVDPRTKHREIPGSVRVRLLVDGKIAWESKLLVAGEEPVPVRVQNLERARELVVIVDFGESFQSGAQGVLGRAMVIKPQG